MTKFLNIKDLVKFGHVSKRMRKIRSDKSLWQKINLAKLSLASRELRNSLTSNMIRSISYQNGHSLQTLNLSFWNGLDLESIEIVTKNCVELKNIDLAATDLSKDSIKILVTNLTPRDQ